MRRLIDNDLNNCDAFAVKAYKVVSPCTTARADTFHDCETCPSCFAAGSAAASVFAFAGFFLLTGCTPPNAWASATPHFQAAASGSVCPPDDMARCLRAQAVTA